MTFPSMVKIEQDFDLKKIEDIPGEIRSGLKGFEPEKAILPGQSVAITAGSRGIHKIDVILKALIEGLKEIEARPFIVPAMGSHGGATSEGQKEVLAHYGITEKTMGVPIKSSMEVIQVGETAHGIPVLLDKNAAQADHIVVVNRVKPHTDFKNDIESGLMKMIAIGLGKQKAADHYHNEFMRYGHYEIITSVAREAIKKSRILFGLAVVENQRDETQIIKMIPVQDFEETEKKLLVAAKELLPRLPFDSIDILIVDEMGKNFSGTGMDQNVIARTVVSYHQVPETPKILRIFVKDLTDDSEGNATGIGNADFTTKRLVDKIDREYTYMNAMTSSSPEAVRIPPYYVSDREAIEIALNTIPENRSEKVRVVHIQNTLMLEEMYISEGLLDEAQEMGNIRVIGTPNPMDFDERGNMAAYF
jgi:hypothetical protein